MNLKIEGLADVTPQLRTIYDSLLCRLERGMEVISKLPPGEAQKKAEARYEKLAGVRQRIALALDVLEERVEVEERGSSRGRCYLVILSEMEESWKSLVPNGTRHAPNLDTDGTKWDKTTPQFQENPMRSGTKKSLWKYRSRCPCCP